MFKNLTVTEWIALLGFFGGWAVTGLKWLIEKKKIKVPPVVAMWVNNLTAERLTDWVLRAAAFADKTPVERRDWVVEQMQAWTFEHCGYKIPTSIANSLVEYALQLVKAKK